MCLTAFIKMRDFNINFIEKTYSFNILKRMFNLMKDCFTRLFKYEFSLLKIKCFKLIQK